MASAVEPRSFGKLDEGNHLKKRKAAFSFSLRDFDFNCLEHQRVLPGIRCNRPLGLSLNLQNIHIAHEPQRKQLSKFVKALLADVHAFHRAV